MITPEDHFGGKNYLITGGAGFIGSNIAMALHKGGANIIISDRLRSGDKWKNLEGLLIQDIVTPERLCDWLKLNAASLSGIIHMGAISATTESDVDKIIENNFHLSNYLWQVCVDNNLPFIYASSAATYGDGSAGFEDDQSQRALSTLLPLNPYGWSKLIVDRRIVSAIDQGKATPPQWAGLKFFNVYGPNETHKGDMRSVINKIFPLVQASKKISLFKSYNPKYKDGGQLRDFIYVKDCVKVVLWLLENPAISGLFNVGTGKPRSFRDLVVALDRVLGVNSDIEYVDMPESIRDRYQYYTCADTTKITKAGFTHGFTSLEDGIEDYVNCDLLKR